MRLRTKVTEESSVSHPLPKTWAHRWHARHWIHSPPDLDFVHVSEQNRHSASSLPGTSSPTIYFCQSELNKSISFTRTFILISLTFWKKRYFLCVGLYGAVLVPWCIPLLSFISGCCFSSGRLRLLLIWFACFLSCDVSKASLYRGQIGTVAVRRQQVPAELRAVHITTLLHITTSSFTILDAGNVEPWDYTALVKYNLRVTGCWECKTAGAQNSGKSEMSREP